MATLKFVGPEPESFWSASFNGSGYLTIPWSVNFAFADMDVSTSGSTPPPTDYTVEAWVNLSSASGGAIISNDTHGQSFDWHAFLSTSYAEMSANPGPGINFVRFGTSLNPALSLNTWYHVAFVRKNGSVRLYINGVLRGGPFSFNPTNLNRTSISIGCLSHNNPSNFFKGSIADLRVSRSAVYTAPFSPPTAKLTALPDTVLLTLQDGTLRDRSSLNIPITSFGGVTPTAGFSPFFGSMVGAPSRVATRGYIQNLLAGNLTQNQVTSQITTRLSGYATKTYVDAQDARLADSAFIDAGDATRLAKANLNRPGYPFTLDSNGKVPTSKVKLTAMQKYPNTAVAAAGGSASTTNDVALMTLSVPDPGFRYKLLVTGTMSGSVATDNGARPQVTVYRGDDYAVAQGYGAGESYQTPTVGSVSSKMYVSSPFAPAPYPNGIITHRPELGNSSVSYNSDWQNLSWIAVNDDAFQTAISGSMMQAQVNMSNVSLSAFVSYANGRLPSDGIPADNVGRLTAEMRIYSSRSGVVAYTSSNGRTVTGTLSSYVGGLTVYKGDMFTIQVRQSMYCPWGDVPDAFGSNNRGTYATWAPSGSGVSNALTLTPGLAPGASGSEISILPMSFTSQPPMTGPTTLYVRLQSPGGMPVSVLSAPSPRIMAIPIPA